MSLARAMNGAPGAGWIVSIMMFAYALVMLGLGSAIRLRQTRFYFLSIGVIAVTILLTVTDQFGFFDLLILLLNLALLGLLLATRSRYS